MNPRVRSWAALAVTLLLGLGLGLLIGSRLAAQRFSRLNALSHPPMLVDMLHETLDLDDAQRAVLDSLLDAQATQVSQRIQTHRQVIREQMDSLLQSLRPHLRADQWKRLQENLGRPPRRGFGLRPDFGPGGPGMRRDGRGPHGRGPGRRPRGGSDSLDVPPPPPPDID